MLHSGAVILAAGGSSRLGEPKQLLRFEGDTLLRRAVRTAQDAGADPVIVVLGASAEPCREALAGAEVQIVENVHWREGLASSLRLGIAALPEVAGAFILLCDQPGVTPDLLASLLAAEAPIAASFYGETGGPPLYFKRRFFSEILQLQGDTGAKSLLRKYAREVAFIDFPDGLRDVDTPDDRRRLLDGKRP